MRALVGGALLIASLGWAVADSAPSRRATPPKYLRAAAQAFDQAVEAERAGDVVRALGLYDEALQVAPHPAPAFNLAELRRESYRKGGTGAPSWEQVRIDFDVYLALETTAAERARVQRELEQFEREPVAVTLQAEGALDLTAAYVIVDGALVVRPGAKLVGEGGRPALRLMIAPGRHTADIVTDVTSAALTLTIEPGRPLTQTVRAAKPREPGNVMFSGPFQGARWLRGVALDTKRVPRRVTLSPGPHDLALYTTTVQTVWEDTPERALAWGECSPLHLEVSNTGVTYVHFTEGPLGCPRVSVIPLAFAP